MQTENREFFIKWGLILLSAHLILTLGAFYLFSCLTTHRLEKSTLGLIKKMAENQAGFSARLRTKQYRPNKTKPLYLKVHEMVTQIASELGDKNSTTKIRSATHYVIDLMATHDLRWQIHEVKITQAIKDFLKDPAKFKGRTIYKQAKEFVETLATETGVVDRIKIELAIDRMIELMSRGRDPYIFRDKAKLTKEIRTIFKNPDN